MNNYWFKPKSSGFGATPTDWRGWAWIAAFGAVDLISMYFMVLKPALEMIGPTFTQFVTWLLLMTIVAAIFLYVCKIKTDGEWRWRK